AAAGRDLREVLPGAGPAVPPHLAVDGRGRRGNPGAAGGPAAAGFRGGPLGQSGGAAAGRPRPRRLGRSRREHPPAGRRRAEPAAGVQRPRQAPGCDLPPPGGTVSPALPTYSILVTGPESCGNHLATTICQRLTGLPVASNKLIDTEQLVAQGPTIVLRSLPHGGAGSDIGRRCYLPWELLHAHLHAGRDLKLVLVLRDRTISTASKLATGH